MQSAASRGTTRLSNFGLKHICPTSVDGPFGRSLKRRRLNRMVKILMLLVHNTSAILRVCPVSESFLRRGYVLHASVLETVKGCLCPDHCAQIGHTIARPQAFSCTPAKGCEALCRPEPAASRRTRLQDSRSNSPAAFFSEKKIDLCSATAFSSE